MVRVRGSCDKRSGCWSQEKHCVYFRSARYYLSPPPLGTQGASKATGPSLLVLAPTRELALQSAEVIAEAGTHCKIRSICVYGGVPKKDQRKALGAGYGGSCVEVVVATPGRLKDLVQEGSCDLSQVTCACVCIFVFSLFPLLSSFLLFAERISFFYVVSISLPVSTRKKNTD